MFSSKVPTSLPWFCLALILTLFLLYLGWLQPVRYFGFDHDDTIYFSSAQALAEGRGYIIPSLPGTPVQTKYPVVYPWLLSWVWRWFPSFPANLVPATWLTALFGCWSLIAAFQFLRRLLGLGDWPALAIVGVFAFEPNFLAYSGRILSDVPFMALVLTAIVLADSSLSRSKRTWLVVMTGVLAGLSAGMRTIGLAVAVGIFVTALFRREYRKAIVFCLAAAPFLAIALWPVLSGSFLNGQGNETNSLEPGWRQTWLYYTSYGGFWRGSVPSAAVFFKLLKINGLLFGIAPMRYVLAPLIEPTSLGGITVYTILTAVLIAGIVRQARKQEWKLILVVFLFYSLFLLAWPFPQMSRFLLLFLPLFYAGLYVETKRMVQLLVANLRSGAPAWSRALAVGLSIALLAVGGAALWNYARGDRRELSAKAERRAGLLREKTQAYEWIRRHTDANSRIVAYHDALLYLYTGRQALRPIAFSLTPVYTGDDRVLECDLAHITDAPRHVRASFWVMSDDDFERESNVRLIKARAAQIKSVLPIVFRSREGHVQVYDLSCLLEPDRSDCQAITPVLIPEHPCSP